jgi:hypothetical protein
MKAIVSVLVSGSIAGLSSLLTALQGENAGFATITDGQWVTAGIAFLIGTGVGHRVYYTSPSPSPSPSPAPSPPPADDDASRATTRRRTTRRPAPKPKPTKPKATTTRKPKPAPENEPEPAEAVAEPAAGTTS